ncbi:MAG: hypothetical protein E7448_08850 [Ruminococcaceae bacterium]|nr:hypothetical protein [Oscillospiraceae bacterium]
MEGNKYLNLARQARAENNSEDAKLYYGKLREVEPENAEAKFFYAYYAMYEGKNGELLTRFTNLCKSLLSSLPMVKRASISEDEQLITICEIVSAFVPEAWSLNRYMNSKNRETKVGDSYVRVFDASTIASCSKVGMSTIRDLGDEIVKLYPNNTQASKIAVIAWKEYVSLAQKWYAYAPKGEAEVYAEKIKKIDPSYEMPKKAGCISLG